MVMKAVLVVGSGSRRTVESGGEEEQLVVKKERPRRVFGSHWPSDSASNLNLGGSIEFPGLSNPANHPIKFSCVILLRRHICIRACRIVRCQLPGIATVRALTAPTGNLLSLTFWSPQPCISVLPRPATTSQQSFRAGKLDFLLLGPGTPTGLCGGRCRRLNLLGDLMADGIQPAMSRRTVFTTTALLMLSLLLPIIPFFGYAWYS